MTRSGDHWQSSAQAWIDRVESGDPNRDLLLDPVMLGLVERAGGRRVLDVGCGEGRFCRMLGPRGFACTGIDPTPALVARAAALDPDGRYLMASAERLPFADSSFETVVSYLTLCDIDDYRAAIKEAARVLTPGGRFIAANVNTALGPATGWVKDDRGRKLHWPLDHYAAESGFIAEWCGIRIVNYHRPLSDYFGALLGAGLDLKGFWEPVPEPEAVRRHAGLTDCLRVPNFWVTSWRKPV
ncbi:MAG: class I SAM-dependent methyltransferase [Armatimonadetes bacterium]|nr:class I SAM-dependent methyltransferase [Armatimonadota bacterium]